MRVVVFGIVTAGLVGTAGCRKPLPPAAPGSGGDLLAALRESSANPLRARLSFKIDSEPLGLKGSTGGALIVDRPGRLHFAVLGPLGGALATAQTDGERVSVVLRRQSQHLWVDGLSSTLEAWTGEEQGVDALVGLLVGQVPPPERPQDVKLDRGGETASYVRTPKGRGRMHVQLAGAPLRPSLVRIEDGEGAEQLSIRYDEAKAYDAGVFPSGWALVMPSADLELDVRFKSFERLDEAPDVFDTAPPPGFDSTRWGREIVAPR